MHCSLDTRPRLLTLLAVASIAHACDGGKGATDTEVEVCTPPVANAGEDANVTANTLAILDGSGSVDCDLDGDGAFELTYAWSVEAVPAGSTVDATRFVFSEDPTKVSVQPDLPGTYVFSLVVTDAEGTASASDLVVITVGSGNQRPVADCGGNAQGAAGVRSDMDGSASYDPDNSPIQYLWSISSVPSCSVLGPSAIYNGQSPVASLVPDCDGVYVVGLVVTDGEDWSEPAFCTINVAGLNQPPIADAGVSASLSPCASQTQELNGFGSYDLEGDALTYQWSVMSVPAGSSVTDASLSDATIANPSFTWDEVGEYTFQLQVTDGMSWSAPDVVTLTFQDERDNSAPQANAGADVTISNTMDCTTASYVFTCEECPDEEVTLDGSASIDSRDGDELSFQWTEATGTLQIASPTSPVTTAIAPGEPATYNSPSSRSWTVELMAEDCADDDVDQMTVTYTCQGQYTP